MTPELLRLLEITIAALLGGAGVGALIVKAYMANKQADYDADKAGVMVLQEQVNGLRDRVAHLVTQIHELEELNLGTVKKLSDALLLTADREAENKILQAEIDVKTKEIESLQRQNKRKDERILVLEKRAHELELQVADLYTRLREFEHRKDSP